MTVFIIGLRTREDISTGIILNSYNTARFRVEQTELLSVIITELRARLKGAVRCIVREPAVLSLPPSSLTLSLPPSSTAPASPQCSNDTDITVGNMLG